MLLRRYVRSRVKIVVAGYVDSVATEIYTYMYVYVYMYQIRSDLFYCVTHLLAKFECPTRGCKTENNFFLCSTSPTNLQNAPKKIIYTSTHTHTRTHIHTHRVTICVWQMIYLVVVAFVAALCNFCLSFDPATVCRFAFCSFCQFIYKPGKPTAPRPLPSHWVIFPRPAPLIA